MIVRSEVNDTLQNKIGYEHYNPDPNSWLCHKQCQGMTRTVGKSSVLLYFKMQELSVVRNFMRFVYQ